MSYIDIDDADSGFDDDPELVSIDYIGDGDVLYEEKYAEPYVTVKIVVNIVTSIIVMIFYCPFHLVMMIVKGNCSGDILY